MKYYLLFFTAAYVVITIIFAVISTLLNLPSSTGMAPLVAVGFLTAWQFVKREQRIPTPEEKKKLIWGSIASTFVVSIVLAAVLVMATMSIQDVMAILKDVPSWIWFVAFGFVILIEYFILHMSFGWYAKTCLKSLENKKRLN
jgi:hypothetical protein